MRKQAFTLIELLVVIAIIAILAAILFPVFAQAKLAAKKTVALSNTKQIALGLAMYVNDVDDTMPTASGCATPINGGQGFQNGCPNPSDAAIPIDGQLAPYIKSRDLWASPADGTPIDQTINPLSFYDGQQPLKRRSYQYVSTIVDQEWEDNGGAVDWGTTPLTLGDPNTGMSGWGGNPKSATSMSDPADTVAIAEIWTAGPNPPMGVIYNSAMLGCDIEKLAGRKVPAAGQSPTGGDVLPGTCNDAADWSVIPTAGYGGTANYALTDGHAKAMTWGAVRKNDFALFKIQKSSVTYNP